METEGQHDIHDPKLVAAMETLRREFLSMIDRRGEELGIPGGLRPNVVLSVQATFAAHLFCPPEWRNGDLRFEETVREGVRRLSDACLSVQDYVERRTPWRPQSKAMRDAEREGAQVVRVGEQQQ